MLHRETRKSVDESLGAIGGSGSLPAFCKTVVPKTGNGPKLAKSSKSHNTMAGVEEQQQARPSKSVSSKTADVPKRAKSENEKKAARPKRFTLTVTEKVARATGSKFKQSEIQQMEQLIRKMKIASSRLRTQRMNGLRAAKIEQHAGWFSDKMHNATEPILESMTKLFTDLKEGACLDIKTTLDSLFERFDAGTSRELVLARLIITTSIITVLIAFALKTKKRASAFALLTGAGILAYMSKEDYGKLFSQIGRDAAAFLERHCEDEWVSTWPTIDESFANTDDIEEHLGPVDCFDFIAKIAREAKNCGMSTGPIPTAVTQALSILRGVSSATSGIKAVLEMLKMLSNWACGSSTEGNSFFDQGRLKSDLVEWVRKADEHLGTVFSKRVGTNYKAAEEVVRHAREGFILRQRLVAAQGSSNVTTTAFESSLRLYRAMLDTALLVVSDAGVRQLPVGILLPGPAGIGKTTFLVQLLTDVLNRLYPGQAHGMKDFYRRNAEDDFWSRYHGQKVTIFDDLLKTLDAALVTKELSTVQEAIDTVPLPLNMAAVEDKGKEFISEFVCMTTNATWPKPGAEVNGTIKGSLRDFSAVQRRIHYRVDLSVKAAFLTDAKRLAAEKVRNARACVDDVYEISVTSIDGNQDFATQKMTYEELVISILSTARERKLEFQRRVEAVRTNVKPFEKRMIDDATRRVLTTLLPLDYHFLLDMEALPFHEDLETWWFHMRELDQRVDRYDFYKLLHDYLATHGVVEAAPVVPINYIARAMSGCKVSAECAIRYFMDKTKEVCERHVVSLPFYAYSSAAKIRDNLERAFNSAPTALPSPILLKTLTAMTSFAGMCLGVYGAMRAFKALDENSRRDADDELEQQSDTRKAVKIPTKVQRPRTNAPRNFRPMMEEEKHAGNAFGDVPGPVLSNVVEFEIPTREDGVKRGIGMFLDATTLVTAKHVARVIVKESDSFFFDSEGTGRCEMKNSRAQFLCLPDADIALIIIPLVNGVKNVRKFLKAAPEREEDFSTSKICRLTRRKGVTRVVYSTSANVCDIREEGGSPVKERSLLYNNFSVAGESGSPVIEIDDDGKPHIIAVHRGILGPQCVASMIYVDDFETEDSVEAHVGDMDDEAETYDFLIDEVAKFCDRHGFKRDDWTSAVPLGTTKLFEERGVVHTTISDDVLPRRFNKTRLQASPLSLSLDPRYNTKAPALLSLRDGHLTRRAIDNLVPCTIERHPQYPTALRVVREYLLDAMQKCESKNIHMTYDRVVHGCKKLNFFQSVDWKTSVGLPYTARTHQSFSKEELLLDADGDVNRETRGCIDEMVACALDEEPLQSYFISCDTLKDELRPIDKQRKTRVFSVLPVNANLLVRAVYGPAMDALMSSRFLHPIRVGTNPYNSIEWESSIIYVGGPNFGEARYICADFSAFDKTMSTQVIKDALQILADWHTLVPPNRWENENIEKRERIFRSEEEYEATHRAVADALARNIHFGDGVAYLAEGSNPSGNAATVIINSITNLIYLTCTHIDMTGRFEIPACIVYGDDLVLRKCDEYDYYDLADDLARYGVRLQPATKDGHEVADVGLESATFLKRHFTPQTFGCVANMEIKDIVPSLFWFRNTETISDTCNSALREIALYGHKTFTDWRRSIACACEDAGVPTEHLLTWNEIITLMQVMVTGLPLYGDMQDAFEIRWKQVLTSRKTCLPMGLGVAPPPQDELDKLSSSRAPEAAYAATLREHLSGRDSCVRVIVTSTSNSYQTNNLGNFEYTQNATTEGEGDSDVVVELIKIENLVNALQGLLQTTANSTSATMSNTGSTKDDVAAIRPLVLSMKNNLENTVAGIDRTNSLLQSTLDKINAHDMAGAYVIIGGKAEIGQNPSIEPNSKLWKLYSYADALVEIKRQAGFGVKAWMVPLTNMIYLAGRDDTDLGRFYGDPVGNCFWTSGWKGGLMAGITGTRWGPASRQWQELAPDEIAERTSIVEEHMGDVVEREKEVEINSFVTTGEVEDSEGGDFLPDPLMRGTDQKAVLNFIQRRRALRTIKWDAASGRGKLVYVVDPLREILSSNMVKSKLLGWRYLTTDVKVTILVTGNKFMGGRMAAVWIPPNRVDEMSNFNTITKVTSIREKVLFHPTENGEYSIVLPGLLTRRAFDLRKAANGWTSAIADADMVTCGLLAFYVISPFVTDDNIDACSFSVWAELVNTELASVYDPGLSFGGMTPNVPDNWSTTNTDCDLRLLTNFVTEARSFSLTSVTEHVGVVEATGKTVREAYKAHTPFASIAYGAAQFAAATSVVWPMMAPVSFFASIASAILSRFKYDRPVERLPPTRVLPKWKDMSRCDGVDETTHLGLKMNNSSIPVGPGEPVNTDEFDISHIASTPATIMATQLDPTAPQWKVIMEWAVAPWNSPCTPPKKAGSTGFSATTFISHTFASYLSNCFMWWKGTAVVEVDVVAQGFAKAIIGVAWLPGDAEGDFTVKPYPTDPTYTLEPEQYNNMLTKFVQVDGSCSVQLEIPFNTSEYWLNSNIEVLGPRGYGTSGEIGTNGKVIVFVVNPPTTVTTTVQKPIDVLLNVGWKDLCFMRPSTSELSSTGHGSSLGALVTAEEHVGKFEEASVFGGESVTSVLDLARRPTYLGKHTQTDALLQDCVVTSVFSHAPLTLQVVSPDVINRFDVTNYKPRIPLACNSFLNYLSRMYIVWRGEITYTAVNFATKVDSSAEVASESVPVLIANAVDRSRASDFNNRVNILEGSGTDNFASTVTAASATAFGAGAFYRPMNSPGIPASASAPFYSSRSFFLTPDLRHVSLPTEEKSNAYYLRATYFDKTYPGVRIESGGTASTTTYIYAAASDCFTFGLLYAPPSSSHLICAGRGLSSYTAVSSWASLM